MRAHDLEPYDRREPDVMSQLQDVAKMELSCVPDGTKYQMLTPKTRTRFTECSRMTALGKPHW